MVPVLCLAHLGLQVDVELSIDVSLFGPLCQ